jgi:hypothetical protein
MKRTEHLSKFFALVAACLLIFSVSANAQRRKSTAKKTNETTVAGSFEIKEGAQKVSTQLKNLTRFLYNYGNVAQVIEALDRDIRDGRASRSAPDLSQKNKRAVLATIRDFQTGLAALEVEFRTKPSLKPYLFQINGVTDIAGTAVEQAENNQFVESGKTLLLVIEKLSDELAAMP